MHLLVYLSLYPSFDADNRICVGYLKSKVTRAVTRDERYNERKKTKHCISAGYLSTQEHMRECA